MNDHDAATRVMERIEELARRSDDPDRLTRGYGSQAMQAVNALVLAWMGEAGMSVCRDQIGNLRGRYPGLAGATKTLLLGSHLDTVRDAGKYDGPLGVLIALQAVEQLFRAQQRLPFAIELLAFADEEGLRFGSAYLGSKVVAGLLEPETLALVDANGVTLHDGILAFGGDPRLLEDDRRRPADLLGYCEVHIEQGPVLEAEHLPVGIVTAIAGQTRIQACFEGMAGHAGTVPLRLRRDALCAAAEFVLMVEQFARATEGLVATVGQLLVEPGAGNVIPGRVTLSLDVRHQDDAVRGAACDRLQHSAVAGAQARGVAVAWQQLQTSAAVVCDPALTGVLAEAVAAQGIAPRFLVSGAGHDAAIMAALAPVAMLFVRCEGGISHHPAEAVSHADVAVTMAVLNTMLRRLCHEEAAT